MAKLDLDPLDLEPIEQEEKLDLEPLDLEPVESISEERGFTEDKPSQLEATIRGLGQSLGGFSDEIAGGLQAAADVATTENELKDFPKLYRAYRDLQRERDLQASEDFPKTSLASEVAGSIPLAFTGAGAANTASKAAKLAGITGLGKSEAELTDPTFKSVAEAGIDTGSSALLGKYAHKGSEYLGQGLKNIKAGKPFSSIGDVLETEAEDTALSALGASKKALERERGGSSAEIGYRRGIGEKALENIKATGGPEAVRTKTIQQIDAIEEAKKPLIKEANDKLQQVIGTGNLTDTSDILLSDSSLASTLNELKNKVINHKKTVSTNIGEVQGLDDRLSETVQRYSGKDNDIFSLNELKKALGKELGDASFSKRAVDLPEEAEFLRKTYSLVNKRIEELANKVSPDLGSKIKAMNMEESNLIGLRDIAYQTELKGAQKGTTSADLAVGGIGAAVGALGGPATSAALSIGSVLGKKGLERATGWEAGQLAKIKAAQGLSKAGKQFQNISQTVESASIPNAIARPIIEESKQDIKDVISNAPVKLSENLYNANEQELNDVAAKLESNKQFSVYGSALKKALSDGSNEKKNAALFTILQNPNMRRLIYGEELVK